MTEPVEGINRAREIVEKIKRGKGDLRKDKHAGHHSETDDDCIDISDEARERASGRNRKNILDYINGDNA